MGFLHRLRVAVWGVPPDTAAERRLLFKIDFFVLTYVCLMYWVGINFGYLTALERLAND
jgi:ACS family pantothenate transporter-like MFS transporter